MLLFLFILVALLPFLMLDLAKQIVMAAGRALLG